jgi:hypothetical protein
MKLTQKLVQELDKNEHIIHIVPFDELVLEHETTKKAAKTTANYVAPTNDAVTAARLIRDFGVEPNKVRIKQYGGKKYVIFKGNPATRKVIRGTRYLAKNPKVVRMAIGPRGVAKSVKGGFVITAVLCVGIEVFDYVIRDTATLHELFGTITSDLIQIGISSIAAAAAGLAVGSTLILGSTVAAPLIAAIAVGLATGWILKKIDEHTGATKALIEAYRKIGVKLDEIEYEAARWYNYFDHNPSAIMRLFGGPSINYGYGY